MKGKKFEGRRSINGRDGGGLCPGLIRMHPGSISISTGNDCLPGDRVIQGSVIAQNERETERVC